MHLKLCCKAMLVESYPQQKLWMKKSSKHLDSRKSVCWKFPGGHEFFFCQPKKKTGGTFYGVQTSGKSPPLWQNPQFCGSHFGAPGLAWLANIPHLPTWKRDFPTQIRRRWVDERHFFSHLSITMAYIYIYKYTYIYIHIYIYTYIHKVPSWKLTYPIKGPGKLLSRWFSELPILVGYVIDRSLEGNRYWILYTILLPERQIWNAEETYISENPNRKFTSFQNPFQHGKTIAASN